MVLRKSLIINGRKNDGRAVGGFSAGLLDERTFEFAEQVISFARLLPRDPATAELIRQVVRSSGSVGANYVETSESLGRKDFLMRARICRKEAKETAYWLRLLKGIRPQLDEQRCSLIQEAS